MLKELEKERATNDWAVKIVRAGRRGRLEELKKKRLI